MIITSICVDASLPAWFDLSHSRQYGVPMQAIVVRVHHTDA